MDQFESEKQNQSEVYATDKEYKDYLKKEFGNFNQLYADDDGVILHFERYYAKNALVGVSIDGFGGKKRFKTEIPPEIFEDFIGRLPGNRGRLEDLLGLQKKKQKNQSEPDENQIVDVAETETEAEEKTKDSAVLNKTDAESVNFEKQNNEKNAELLEKERLVFEARKAYAMAHFKTKSAFTQIKRVLGEKFGKKVEDVPDIVERYQIYQEKLRKLKEFKLNALRDKVINLHNSSSEDKEQKTIELEKELGELITYFNYDEKIKLYKARTNAGVEAQESGLGREIFKKSADLVNDYRKLNWKRKLLISGVLMAGGVGATMVGATSVGFGFGILKVGQRIIGGAASGVGTSGMMEMFAKRSQEKEAKKKKEAIFSEFETIDERNEFEGKNDTTTNWEDKFNMLGEKLEEEINSYAESLKNERSSVKKRFIAGLVASAFVISGAPGYLAKWGLGLDSSQGNFHWLSDRLGITKPNVNLETAHNIATNIHHPGATPEVGNVKIIPTQSPVAMSSAEHPNILPSETPANIPHTISDSAGGKLEQIIKAPKNIDTEKLVPGSVEKTLDGVRIKPKVPGNIFEHVVAKNENVEKIIIHQKLAEGMSRPDANRLAHQIASNPKNLESIEKLSKIKPGEKVIVDWEKGTVKIDHQSVEIHHHARAIEIHKPKMAGINQTEHISQGRSSMSSVTHKMAGGISEGKINNEDHAMSGIEKLDTGSQHIESAISTKPITSIFAESAEFQKEIIKAEELKKLAEEAYKRAKFFDKYNFTGARDALDAANKKYEILYQNIFRKISGDAFGESGVKGGLDGLKKIKATDFISANEGNNPKFEQFLRYAQAHFGEKAVRVKSGETMFSWTSRIVGKIMTSKGIDFDLYANKIYDVSK